MKVDKKKQEEQVRAEIQKLTGSIRYEYPHSILQELIAEIILNTSTESKDQIYKRFKKTVRALFGPPIKAKKKHTKDADLYLYAFGYFLGETIEKYDSIPPKCLDDEDKKTMRWACREAVIDKMAPGLKGADRIAFAKKNREEIEKTAKRLYDPKYSDLLKNPNVIFSLLAESPIDTWFFSDSDIKDAKQSVRFWLDKYGNI